MPESPSCPHQNVCATVPAQAHFHAVAQFSGLAALRVLTLNHRNIGVGMLAEFAAGAHGAAHVQEALCGAGVESFVLATCNRTEIYWRARVPGDDETALAAFAGLLGPKADLESLPGAFLRGRAAALHLFRVCCGLESLVVGEAEVLGQVRTALDASVGAGPFLSGVVQAALRAGRLARAETRIGVGALSVASAAVQCLARTLSLPASRAIVVGAGDTGVKAARHLRALGVGQLAIANRTLAHAAAAAEPLQAAAIPLEALAGHLDRVDTVICALSTPDHVLRLADLRRIAALRDGRPFVVVDVSMPAAVEPGEVAGVVRIDLSAIERQVNADRERRAAEVPKVEAVITRELDRLQSWARQQALRPIVSELRRKVEAIRQAELARAQSELPAAHRLEADVMERLSRRLLEQVLAIPLATLEAGDVPLDPTQAQYLRRLFALGPGAAPCR